MAAHTCSLQRGRQHTALATGAAIHGSHSARQTAEDYTSGSRSSSGRERRRAGKKRMLDTISELKATILTLHGIIRAMQADLASSHGTASQRDTAELFDLYASDLRESSAQTDTAPPFPLSCLPSPSLHATLLFHAPPVQSLPFHTPDPTTCATPGPFGFPFTFPHSSSSTSPSPPLSVHHPEPLTYTVVKGEGSPTDPFTLTSGHGEVLEILHPSPLPLALHVSSTPLPSSTLDTTAHTTARHDTDFHTRSAAQSKPPPTALAQHHDSPHTPPHTTLAHRLTTHKRDDGTTTSTDSTALCYSSASTLTTPFHPRTAWTSFPSAAAHSSCASQPLLSTALPSHTNHVAYYPHANLHLIPQSLISRRLNRDMARLTTRPSLDCLYLHIFSHSSSHTAATPARLSADTPAGVTNTPSSTFLSTAPFPIPPPSLVLPNVLTHLPTPTPARLRPSCSLSHPFLVTPPTPSVLHTTPQHESSSPRTFASDDDFIRRIDAACDDLLMGVPDLPDYYAHAGGVGDDDSYDEDITQVGAYTDAVFGSYPQARYSKRGPGDIYIETLGGNLLEDNGSFTADSQTDAFPGGFQFNPEATPYEPERHIPMVSIAGALALDEVDSVLAALTTSSASSGDLQTAAAEVEQHPWFIPAEEVQTSGSEFGASRTGEETPLMQEAHKALAKDLNEHFRHSEHAIDPIASDCGRTDASAHGVPAGPSIAFANCTLQTARPHEVPAAQSQHAAEVEGSQQIALPADIQQSFVQLYPLLHTRHNAKVQAILHLGCTIAMSYTDSAERDIAMRRFWINQQPCIIDMFESTNNKKQ